MQTILGVYQNNILMKFKKFTKELKSWFKFAKLAKPNPWKFNQVIFLLAQN